jgi:hypothetical protein
MVTSYANDEHHPTGRPAWLRPDAVLPAMLTPDLMLAHTGDVAVCIPLLSAYPAGFELELVVIARTDVGERLIWALHPSHSRRPSSMTVEEIFRFAVLYADGRAATNLEQHLGLAPGAQGLTMTPSSSGSAPGNSGMVYYVQPLPPPGPLTFICEWPAQGIAETRVEIDAQRILDASTRAVRLWPEHEGGGVVTSSFEVGFPDEEPNPEQGG